MKKPHQWKKYLSNSGMYFIDVCEKCGAQTSHVDDELLRKQIEETWVTIHGRLPYPEECNG